MRTTFLCMAVICLTADLAIFAYRACFVGFTTNFRIEVFVVVNCLCWAHPLRFPSSFLAARKSRFEQDSVFQRAELGRFSRKGIFGVVGQEGAHFGRISSAEQIGRLGFESLAMGFETHSWVPEHFRASSRRAVRFARKRKCVRRRGGAVLSGIGQRRWLLL